MGFNPCDTCTAEEAEDYPCDDCELANTRSALEKAKEKLTSMKKKWCSPANAKDCDLWRCAKCGTWSHSGRICMHCGNDPTEG